jgi:hypothetical protein
MKTSLKVVHASKVKGKITLKKLAKADDIRKHFSPKVAPAENELVEIARQASDGDNDALAEFVQKLVEPLSELKNPDEKMDSEAAGRYIEIGAQIKSLQEDQAGCRETLMLEAAQDGVCRFRVSETQSLNIIASSSTKYDEDALDAAELQQYNDLREKMKTSRPIIQFRTGK